MVELELVLGGCVVVTAEQAAVIGRFAALTERVKLESTVHKMVEG